MKSRKNGRVKENIDVKYSFNNIMQDHTFNTDISPSCCTQNKNNCLMNQLPNFPNLNYSINGFLLRVVVF